MPKQQRIIALSPTPECLCLAAVCRSAWDNLMIAGRNWIVTVIDDLLENPSSVKELMIIVPQVNNRPAVRKALTSLTSTGITVTWFACDSSDCVREVTSGLKNVTLHTASTLGKVIRARFGHHRPLPLLDDFDNSKPDLADFLRYKISLSFMRAMDPEPLLDAINELAKSPDAPFSLNRLGAADQASMTHFRDADFPYIEGQSDRVMALKERVRKVAPTDLSIMILGETGTGKESIAFYIHEFSKRRSRPFVALNCAGLQETFLRSELFGHRKGSFTGAITDKKGLVEEADGGTLFLDEVGEMPIAVQADLLRFLQTRRFRPMGDTRERSVDLRVVAATQPDLKEKIAKGEFRPDLYFRISDVELISPALREVPDDIIRLVRHIAYRSANGASTANGTSIANGASAVTKNQNTKASPYATPEATIAYFEGHEDKLKSHPLPGNVRQLIQMVRCRQLLGDDVLGNDISGTNILSTDPSSSHCSHSSHSPISFDSASSIIRPEQILSLDEMTRSYVRSLSNRKADLGLTQKDLSDRLGISVNTLKKHLNDNR